MTNIKKSNTEFKFWRKPWHKWIILFLAVLQLILLCYNVNEFVSILPEKFSNAYELNDFLSQKYMLCIINVVMAILLFGCFIIGMIVKNKRQSNIATAIIIFIILLFWAVSGVILWRKSLMANSFIWIIVFLIIFFSGVFFICSNKIEK